MKKLISVREIEDLKKSGQKVYCIDENTIVTPSAKDAAASCGIELMFDKEMAECKTSASDVSIDSSQIYKVLKMLMEQGMLEGIFKPYEEERHSRGLKVIRGNTVSMDVFDTGNPKANVYFQELVSKEEAHMSAGFLVIDHSDFDWELTYEEIDYVIEGTLQVTIDGEVFIAHSGDVLFVPSNSKVNWCSPDKARIFYATYPANWADLL